MALTLRWLGQGGFLLDDGMTRIAIDPYLSDSVSAAEGSPRLVPPPIAPDALCVDALITTHDHIDHLDPDTLRDIHCEKTRYIAPPDCGAHLDALGKANRTLLDENEKTACGAFTIKAVFAHHTVPAMGVLIAHGVHTLYFTGDTLYDKRLEARKADAIDVLFICINGKLGNMSADEAAALSNAITPHTAIPMHYGMFASNTQDPRRFIGLIDNGFEMKFNTLYTLDALIDRK